MYAIKTVRQVYNKFIILQASFFREKVRFLQKSTADLYIKQYKRHNYPMKTDVTNVHYYNMHTYLPLSVSEN
jgi:hypothetical protein